MGALCNFRGRFLPRNLFPVKKRCRKLHRRCNRCPVPGARCPVRSTGATPLPLACRRAYGDFVGHVVYRDGALADGRSDRLRVGVSILVTDGRIGWIRPSGDEGELPPDCEVVDAGGSTFVPGMVDGHSHLTLPGGSHWIDRGSDPTDTLLAVAETNGELQYRSGIRWARDVGSPMRDDGEHERALAIGIRERWRGRRTGPTSGRERGCARRVVSTQSSTASSSMLTWPRPWPPAAARWSPR
jgi:hypothetical protein